MAQSLRAIRRKIKAVGNIWQITRAMQMVAASKLKRVQPRVEASRAYLSHLDEIMRNLAGNVPPELHPYLQERPVANIGLLLIAGDKGLAGSHNVNILRAAEEFIGAQEVPVKVLTVGNKAGDYARRRGWELVDRLETPSTGNEAREGGRIARQARALFDDGTVDQVIVAYTQFISPLRRPPTLSQVLPIVGEEHGEEPSAEYLFEPRAEELLGGLLPRTVEAQIVNMILQSVAAEHAARMTAMSAATENAAALRDNLTRELNRARQAAITTELLEVVAGADALAGG